MSNPRTEDSKNEDAKNNTQIVILPNRRNNIGNISIYLSTVGGGIIGGLISCAGLSGIGLITYYQLGAAFGISMLGGPPVMISFLIAGIGCGAAYGLKRSRINNNPINNLLNDINPTSTYLNSSDVSSIAPSETSLYYQLTAIEERNRVDRNNILYIAQTLRQKQGINITLVEYPEYPENNIGKKRTELKSLKRTRDILIDPISLEMMQIPVEADDGNIYDLVGLLKHYDSCIKRGLPPRCPKNPNQSLSNPANLPESKNTIHLLGLVASKFGSIKKFENRIESLEKEIEELEESGSKEPNPETTSLAENSSGFFSPKLPHSSEIHNPSLERSKSQGNLSEADSKSVSSIYSRRFSHTF